MPGRSVGGAGKHGSLDVIMSNTDSTAALGNEHRGTGGAYGRATESASAGLPAAPATKGVGGFFDKYKPEQGQTVRVGSFIGAMALVLWGMVYLYNRLEVYAGDESWRLAITVGIPIGFAVVFGSLAWWIIFGRRDVGDFMIATEGEMKKVNWSSRGEIIGSTKVVIVFTLFMAVLIFVIDLAFQAFMTFIGVLKV